MMAKKMHCGFCDHFFDPTDKRAHITSSEDPRFSSSCPACTIERYRGVEMWAVWNSCQGIWGDGVGWTRKEAYEHLNSGRYDGCECKVIPIRVYEEPADNWHMREWVENRDRGEQACGAG